MKDNKIVVKFITLLWLLFERGGGNCVIVNVGLGDFFFTHMCVAAVCVCVLNTIPIVK